MDFDKGAGAGGLSCAAVALGLALSCTAQAQQAVYSVKLLTPETALKAAQAALKRCRDNGYQVSVAVTDRMGRRTTGT